MSQSTLADHTTEPTTTNTTSTDTNDDAPDNITDTDDIHDAAEAYLDDLEAAATDDEHRETVMTWLNEVADLSISRYSPNNQIALRTQLQNRDDVDAAADGATHFAGFNTWLDKGRHVEDGETGFKVLAPVTGPACPECGNAPGYHEGRDDLDCPRAGEDPDEWDFDPSEEWSEGTYYYRTETVFAFEQTAPNDDADDPFEPLDMSASGDAERGREVRAAVQDAARDEFGVEIEYLAGEEYAARFGDSNGVSTGNGRAYVKQRDDPADEARTAIHELAHEELHEHGLPDGERDRREVEAEATAYVVARRLGLDPDGSELYVSRWNGDREELRGRMKNVTDAAAEIIEAVEAELRG